jgi:hypothetical protein
MEKIDLKKFEKKLSLNRIFHINTLKVKKY